MFEHYLLNKSRRKYFSNHPDFCLFCEPENVKQTLIYKDNVCVVLANKYPYGSGHILVAPREHIHHPTELKNPGKFFKRLLLFYEAVQKAYKPDGMNMGMSSGKAAGASIKHLHFHILPRWYGDLGFMEIIDDTKVLVESPETIKENVKRALSEFGLLDKLK